MQGEAFIGEFFPVVPEIFTVGMTMLLLVAGVYRGDGYSSFVLRASIFILVLSAVLQLQLWDGDYLAMNEMFRTDGFAVFVKLIILFSACIALMLSLDFCKSAKGGFEYPILMLFAVVGMLVMVSANDLISLYLGLELQSLSLYVLATIDKDSKKSSEAGLKYFVLGALASGLLLYGCSLVYGFSGTTNFDALAGMYQREVDEELGLGLLIGIILVVIGLCFKVSAVPFHMWTPDVYEGAPTPVTAFFSTAPKIAAMALFIRVMIQPFGSFSDNWQQVIIFVAVASMLVGAFGALKQTNIKRLMAYSSIGHVGYMLVGLAAGAIEGIQAMLIYLTIYAFMSLGMFACILRMKRRGEALEKISDFSGLAKSNPAFALVVAILMFSMAGIPPMAGFFGKFFIFKAALGAGLYGLAVIGVLTSVVAAFYYIRIVKLMYFDDVEDEIDEELLPELKAVLAGAGLFNVLFFIFPTSLLELTKVAAATLFL